MRKKIALKLLLISAIVIVSLAMVLAESDGQTNASLINQTDNATINQTLNETANQTINATRDIANTFAKIKGIPPSETEDSGGIDGPR
jgi:hypothetical protein